MPIIGLTGDVGAGKSTLCSEFALRGAHIIDADSIARSLWDEREIQKKAEEHWGSGFFNAPKREVYSKIAAIIFNDENEYKFAQSLLNAKTIELIKEDARKAGGLIIAEIPLLYEGGHEQWLDAVIYAEAPFEKRLERNVKRNWDANEIKRREKRLLPHSDKISRADYVLVNDGTEEEWRQKARKLFQILSDRFCANKISLPDVDIELINCKKLDRILLAAGGRETEKEYFNKMLENCSSLWAVDKGAEICRKANVLPEKIIGDLDSASKETVDAAYAANICIEKFNAEKDLTDFQLALAAISRERKEPVEILLTGAWGGRFDHLYSLIFSFAESTGANTARLISDEQETMLILNGGECAKINFKKNVKALSLLPLSEKCSGVSVSGVHWSLNNAELIRALPYAVSNRAEDKNNVTISVAQGKLGVYYTAYDAAD